MSNMTYPKKLCRLSAQNSGYPTTVHTEQPARGKGMLRYFVVEATPEGDFTKGPFTYRELVATLEPMAKPRPPLEDAPYQWKGHG